MATDKLVALNDDQILEIVKECFPWQTEAKINDLLTYEKSPPMFPQATYDVPSYRAERFVRAVEKRIHAQAEATISALEAEIKRLREANAELREVIEPFAKFSKFVAVTHPGWDHDTFDIGPLFDGLVSMGHFRRARDISRNRRES